MAQDAWKRFEEFLRKRGKNVTRSRRKVLQAVLSQPGHFDATEIWEKLRRERVSIATVYRTLELLEEAGLIRKVRLGEAHAHYEHTLAGGEHGHLVCRNCGKVVEFELPGVRERVAGIAEEAGFTLEGIQIQVLGLCPDCRRELP